MEERTFIPGSPACGQWETVFADALDGLLGSEDEVAFTAHLAACSSCAAFYEQARKGRAWLEFLVVEPEMPAGLLRGILSETGPAAGSGAIAEYGQAEGGSVLPMPRSMLPATLPAKIPAWQRPGLVGQLLRFAEPRLMMTAAMAFFSIAVTLNLTGIQLSGLRLGELRPSTVRSFMERRLTMASTPIVRYYDNSRLVYEVQLRVRALRKATAGVAEEHRQEPKEAAPGDASGESKQVPVRKQSAPRFNAPEQSAAPTIEPEENDPDILETTLASLHRPAYGGARQGQSRERSRRWIA